MHQQPPVPGENSLQTFERQIDNAFDMALQPVVILFPIAAMLAVAGICLAVGGLVIAVAFG